MTNVNVDEFVSFPREMLTGVLTFEATSDAVAGALQAAGVSGQRVRFLQGEDGLRILNPEGDHGKISERLKRKAEHFTAEGDILERMAQALRDGRTVLGVFEVHEDDVEALSEVCRRAGVEELHYFGRWRID